MNQPPSHPPAGVPQSSGNKKYALIVLILLAGIGVTMWLRRTPNQPQTVPAPVASIAPPPATTNPKLEDIPPPPPEETADAGSGGPRIVYVYQNVGCDGKCRGTYPPELGQALQVRAAQARRCYNSALARDPSLKGHVSITVRVSPSGNVCSAAVASNDMGSPAVANCAANIFRSASGLPSPHGGCAEAIVPMSFVPQEH